MPSRFRSVAMARGDFPAANSLKIRRTIVASASLILRSPRTGSPSLSMRFLQQRLDARPENDAGAGDGGIMIGIDDLPTLLARMFSTDAELVLDRRHALVVGRVAGVKRNLEHDVLSGSGLHIDSTNSAAVKIHVRSGVRRHRLCPFRSGSLTVACANAPRR